MKKTFREVLFPLYMAVVVIIVIVTINCFGHTEKVDTHPKPLYHDDGKGLVTIHVEGLEGPDDVLRRIVAWRDAYPERFRRHVSIWVGTCYYYGAVISYIPADSVKISSK